ncbi:MAG TPA: hypothetical protein VK524_31550 [Polyangiaceae bacterium]|nr:hypothetical protein [Polyangiaceae bacterium]
MQKYSFSFVALFAVSVATACGGASDENSTDVEVASTTQQGLADCQVTSTTAFCATTTPTPPVLLGRSVFYRVGANTGPGYDAATGRHAAVVLFQGTSEPGAGEDNAGGNNGPGTAWNVSVPISREFGGYYQVATVVALVSAGYTVIQPAARRRPVGYFWDTNAGIPLGSAWGTASSPGPDRQLMNALVAQLQPGASLFGPIDIHHVYAMGISSGGYMSSRIANEYAGGINANSTVKVTSKPFRAVAIQSAAYQNCSNRASPTGFFNCVQHTAAANLPTNHPPTFFLHDDTNEPIVDFATADAYYGKLGMQFPTGNPVYTVNGVQETFRRLDTFNGESEPEPGHQWSDLLTGDSSNDILEWFNSHR